MQNRIYLPFCYEVLSNSQYAVCWIASRIGFVCNRDTITMQGVLIERTSSLCICFVLFRIKLRAKCRNLAHSWVDLRCVDCCKGFSFSQSSERHHFDWPLWTIRRKYVPWISRIFINIGLISTNDIYSNNPILNAWQAYIVHWLKMSVILWYLREKGFPIYFNSCPKWSHIAKRIYWSRNK